MASELKDRVVNALRACRNTDDLVALDEQLSIDCRDIALHRLICDGLYGFAELPRWRLQTS